MPRRDDDGDDDEDDEGTVGCSVAARRRAVFNLYSGDNGGKQYGAFMNDFNRLQMRVSDPATRHRRPAWRRR